MAEWMERVVSLYGIPAASVLESQDYGREESEPFDERYRAFTDRTVRSICSRYGATHAVLFSDTATAYPVLARNDTYQLVEIDDCR